MRRLLPRFHLALIAFWTLGFSQGVRGAASVRAHQDVSAGAAGLGAPPPVPTCLTCSRLLTGGITVPGTHWVQQPFHVGVWWWWTRWADILPLKSLSLTPSWQLPMSPLSFVAPPSSLCCSGGSSVVGAQAASYDMEGTLKCELGVNKK